MLNYTILQRITNQLWNYPIDTENVKEKIHLSIAYINLYKLAIEKQYSEEIFKRVESLIFSQGPRNDLLTLNKKDIKKIDLDLLLLYYRLLELKNIKELNNYIEEFQEDIINIDLASLKFINFQILYFVYRRTMDNRYKNKILETIEKKLDSINDYRFYILLYLMTRNPDYLAPAYTLVEPFETLSKDESLDFYIWQISGYDREYYPTSIELRKYILENMINDLDSVETLYIATSFALGEIETWKHDLFGDYTPIINDELNIYVDESNNVGILGRSPSFHKRIGNKGLLYIGKVAEKPEDSLGHFGRDIYLDCVKPHVIFICGHRGSGKSYTMGVIAEELAKTNIGIGTIIVDPMGIFWSMKFGNWIKKEVDILKKWDLKPESYAEKVKIFVPLGFYNSCSEATRDEAFSLLPSELTADDWCYTFGIDRFSPRGILIEKAINQVREGYIDEFGIPVPRLGDYFTISDLIDCINESRLLTSKSQGFDIRTRRAVISRLEIARDWGIFSNTGTKLNDISVPNQISVIDVSFLDEGLRSLIIGILARKILKERLKISRRLEAAKVDGSAQTEIGINEIPVTWLLIDEAHLLIPSSGKTAASEPLIQYAKLGRKPGCGLILVTQQPAATNSQILSQLDILLSHLLTYKSDITALVSRIPGEIPKDIDRSSFFRNMAVGSGLLADESISTSRCFVIHVRPRSSQHAGRESLPRIIEAMEQPVIPTELQREQKSEDLDDTASDTSITSESSLDDINLPKVVAGESGDVIDLNDELIGTSDIESEINTNLLDTEPELPEDSKINQIPAVEIDLPVPALMAYNKRFITYKFYQFLFSFKEHTFSTAVSKEINEKPEIFLKKVCKYLKSKRWICNAIHDQTEIPVVLFEKEDLKIALTTTKSKTNIIATLIGATTDKNKLEFFNTLMNELINASIIEI
ncbi:MAG: ATP-binding protein [Candidatus Helarchaeota archaeon]